MAVNIMVIAFAIFGIMGARSMRSSFFPLIDSKIITIQVSYPGASPQEIEEGVVLKIEENLKVEYVRISYQNKKKNSFARARCSTRAS